MLTYFTRRVLLLIRYCFCFVSHGVVTDKILANNKADKGVQFLNLFAGLR